MILIVYPFIAFNPSSWFRLWLDEVMHKVNLKSLTRKRNPRLSGIILCILGFPDFVLFYILFFLLDLPDLGYLYMMLGKIFKYLGFYNLYLGAETVKGQNIWMYFMIAGVIIYPPQILFFLMNGLW